MEHSNLDRVLYRLNWHGRYQLIQLVLIVVAVFPGSLNILSYIFVGYDGPHTCTKLANTSRLSMNVDSVGNDSSISYGECEIVIQSNTSQGVMTEHLECIAGNTYNKHKQVSMVSEWDLVCERVSMSELTQTVFVLGQATGGILCASVSDRFGRKFTHIFSLFMLLVTGFGLSFSQSYYVFTVFRFMAGIFQQGTDLTSATMALEQVPTEKRFLAGTVGNVLWGTALITLAPLAYFLRDVSWRYLQIAVALTAAYSVLLPFTLDETLRWLEANGKTKEIERTLKKAAKANKVSEEEIIELYYSTDVHTDSDGLKTTHKEISITVNNEDKDNLIELVYLPDHPRAHVIDTCLEGVDIGEETEIQHDADTEHEETFTICVDQTEEDDGKTDLLQEGRDCVKGKGKDAADHVSAKSLATKKYTLLDILRNKMIFINTVIVWCCWIVDNLVYYGLFMTESVLAGNHFLNYFLNSVVEVPASLLIFLTLERLGRRRPTLLFHTVAGISLLAAVLLKSFAGNFQAALVMSAVLTLIGKLAISTAVGILFVYTPELFPTNLRNAGLGAASSASRLGGMLAPFAGTLEKKVIWAPGAIFAGICLLAGFLIQFLPETRGHELPLNMEEIREWYRDNVPNKKQRRRELQQEAEGKGTPGRSRRGGNSSKK